MNSNHVLGLLCIIAGIVIAIVAVGDLLVRIIITLAALSLINYGLRLRGLPPLQLLLPLLASRNRWF
ncbi:MAG TPA: hypothetical protein VJ201_03530 [Candidatus Babeliales bacterium]|nr:hypothetical protein [Candidatus Babeliales bacterium]HLC07030.1 hypothetical protein [Candidatus Babeliales bacterium]